MSEAQMRSAFKSGIVQVPEYQELLRGLGYPERDITILTQMMTK